MARTYELTERQAELAFAQVSSHTKALKNWMVSAVESGDFDKAKRLVAELREYEVLFARLNVTSHRLVDEAKYTRIEIR